MKKYLLSKSGKAVQWPLVVCGMLFFSACDDVQCIKGNGNEERRTLTLQPFSELEANGDFKVYITQGEPQKVEVVGESNILSDLSTQVRNGKWEIEHESCVRRAEPVEVYITMPEVKALYLNGSGLINSENKLDVEELPVQVNGSGKIDLELDASKVITRVTGSGEVWLSGRTAMQKINMSGSGRAATADLAAEDVTVNLSGSGEAEVRASKSLTADVSGSGKVYYYGNPAVVSTNISGFGKVVKR
ncbi:head GIN domain-containing protein [Pontibacter toksunensis]|uniref:Head GIN domain-containing protein n=1 Tax=Pontibacter toksunensis TaxID=1332631 RepID=A0ABW6BSV7_9BACT